jgi:hypothetical protein
MSSAFCFARLLTTVIPNTTLCDRRHSFAGENNVDFDPMFWAEGLSQA